MKGSTTRFTVPLTSHRPIGARLLEAFSPKLGRRVRLFDHATFRLWISLEADAEVKALCERPVALNGDAGRMIDFWVQREDREELLLMRIPGDPGRGRIAAERHGDAHPHLRRARAQRELRLRLPHPLAAAI